MPMRNARVPEDPGRFPEELPEGNNNVHHIYIYIYRDREIHVSTGSSELVGAAL